MTVRPILSAMLHNKTGVVLIAAQIAVTLAVIVNALFIVQQRLQHMNRDSGYDTENIIFVTGRGYTKDYNHDQSVTDDIALLKSLPGVVLAVNLNNLPMSGSGSATVFSARPDEDAPEEVANYYFVGTEAFDTFGIKLAAGRNFDATEIMSSASVRVGEPRPYVIVTQAFADKLFPDGKALGQSLYNDLGRSSEIVGIIELMHGAWVSWDGLEDVILWPGIAEGPAIKYAVRTAPGRRDEMIPEIEKALADSNRTRYIKDVEPMSETVATSYQSDRAMAIVLLTVTTLLISVTALGIVGLASFSVRQRTKQIGTRRAVGARRRDILTYFMTENWLITTVGVALGVVLAFALNYWLATEFSLQRLDPLYVPAGILGLWALGLLAVLGPARKASRISPAIATRTV